MIRRLVLLATVAGLLLGPAIPVHARTYLDGYQGPYRGRVVDAETHEPLAGAVVVVIWYRERILPLHLTTVFHAARETLTQPDGSFLLDARDIEEAAPLRTLPATAEVFLPGYASLRSRLFFPRGFQRGDFHTGVTIGLPRLTTTQERRDALRSPFALGVVEIDDNNRVRWLQPRETLKHYLDLINAEAAAVGLSPITY